jgi:hypothetical protein
MAGSDVIFGKIIEILPENPARCLVDFSELAKSGPPGLTDHFSREFFGNVPSHSLGSSPQPQLTSKPL